MLKRVTIASLVLGSTVLAADASAGNMFQVPPTIGMPGAPDHVNPSPLPSPNQIWDWGYDGYIKRTSSFNPPVPYDWFIPLPFYQSSTGNNLWYATVWVSAGTRCSLEWRADMAPGSRMGGTTPVTATADGPLELTSISLCPISGAVAANCITPYATAFVKCSVKGGGFVGAVTYMLTHI